MRQRACGTPHACWERAGASRPAPYAPPPMAALQGIARRIREVQLLLLLVTPCSTSWPAMPSPARLSVPDAPHFRDRRAGDAAGPRSGTSAPAAGAEHDRDGGCSSRHLSPRRARRPVPSATSISARRSRRPCVGPPATGLLLLMISPEIGGGHAAHGLDGLACPLSSGCRRDRAGRSGGFPHERALHRSGTGRPARSASWPSEMT